MSDLQAAPRGSQRGAIWGTALGCNLWLVALGFALLFVDIEGDVWLRFAEVAAVNVALTILIILVSELARRHADRRLHMLALPGVLLTTVGTMLLVFDSLLGARLAADPKYVQVLHEVGAVARLPSIIALLMLVTAIPFSIAALRRVLRGSP